MRSPSSPRQRRAGSPAIRFTSMVARSCEPPEFFCENNWRFPMSKKLEGKTAFVTGASRGIGAAIAKRLPADGARVAITYSRGAEAAGAGVKTIKDAGGQAIAIQADATDAAAVQSAIDKMVASFGKLDVLVNNAGTAIPKAFEESTLEEFDRVIDLNLRGVFIATHAALKHINNGGRIINMG